MEIWTKRVQTKWMEVLLAEQLQGEREREKEQNKKHIQAKFPSFMSLMLFFVCLMWQTNTFPFANFFFHLQKEATWSFCLFTSLSHATVSVHFWLLYTSIGVQYSHGNFSVHNNWCPFIITGGYLVVFPFSNQTTSHANRMLLYMCECLRSTDKWIWPYWMK